MAVPCPGIGNAEIPVHDRDEPGPPTLRPLREPLLVIAPSTAEVVQHAGGWLFDQVMAGRDAAVLATVHADPTPLRILGTRAYDLETALANLHPDPSLRDIVVQADLYAADARIRQIARQILDAGPTEILLWSANWPQDHGGPANVVTYRMSTAALAFKTHALAAATSPDPVNRAEVFWKANRESAI